MIREILRTLSIAVVTFLASDILLGTQAQQRPPTPYPREQSFDSSDSFSSEELELPSMLHFFDLVLKTYPEWMLPNFYFDPQTLAIFGKQAKLFHYPQTTLSFDYCSGLIEAAIEAIVRSANTASNDEDVASLQNIADKCEGYIQKISTLPSTKIFLLGDWHGGIHSLARTFCELIDTKYCDKNLRIINPKTLFFFLGDLVDYGRHSLETLITILDFKIKNPNQVFLCRGNHETQGMNISLHGGLSAEIHAKFPQEQADKFLTAVYKLYEHFPYAIFAEIKGYPEAGFVQFSHGGFDETAEDFIQKLLTNPRRCIVSLDNRYTNGLSNFMWADFHGTPERNRENIRGTGCRHYSIAEAKEIMQRINVRALFRGHQDHDGCFKVLVEGVSSPLYPFPPLWHIGHSSFIGILSDLFVSPSYLARHGFELGELPESAIPPIFTFSSASAARCAHNEGYGILTVNRSWKESNLRVKTFTTPLMNARYALYSETSEKEALSILKQLLPHDTITDQDFIPLIQAFQATVLLPHFTLIEPDGDTEIYPVSNFEDVDYAALLENNAQNFDISNFFHSLLNRYAITPREGAGISKEFMNCYGS